jgi:hypothetical protein
MQQLAPLHFHLPDKRPVQRETTRSRPILQGHYQLLSNIGVE